MRQKKGAIELSIGTIVILVLAMSMLVLGIVLIRTIFTGAKYNVDTINDKVKAEINSLFVEDKKIVVYLGNAKADVKQGQDNGVAFGVKNLKTGTAESSVFNYDVSLESSASDLRTNCGLSGVNIPLTWIKAGKSGSVTLNPGEAGYRIIRFAIPSDAPLCIVRYKISVLTGGRSYTEDFFDLNIGA